jgi:hypothetical protein
MLPLLIRDPSTRPPANRGGFSSDPMRNLDESMQSLQSPSFLLDKDEGMLFFTCCASSLHPWSWARRDSPNRGSPPPHYTLYHLVLPSHFLHPAWSPTQVQATNVASGWHGGCWSHHSCSCDRRWRLGRGWVKGLPELLDGLKPASMRRQHLSARQVSQPAVCILLSGTLLLPLILYLSLYHIWPIKI